MKIIKDDSNDNFNLGKTRNSDDFRYATKSATRKAILAALRNGDSGLLKTVHKLDGDTLTVGVEYLSGRLSLGCHSFSRKVSQLIIRWAGITPTAFATARRVGLKVRRSAN